MEKEDNVKSLRLLLGVTQAEFARMLKITQATVSRWEKGQSMSLANYLKLQSLTSPQDNSCVGEIQPKVE
ncbi:helix-turn-helix domain-containing protein [Bartonella sp. DGB1]|uniref:helix-turn-helix domain-containing protein n=1 Tax=Bartonella sp. DGB1 TaxID=3239807 RepID=UPI0035267F06